MKTKVIFGIGATLFLFAVLAMSLAPFAHAQTAVQKVGGGNNTLSNGSIVVGNNTSITTTGNGSISGNVIASGVPWSGITAIPSPTLTHTGDVTGNITLLSSGVASGALTLATVNANIGTFAGITINGKGLVTAAANLTITTTAPLTGGGTLGNLTFAMPAATTSVNGYLTSTDWTTFNAKQPAGNYITALTGDGTAAGPGSAVFTLAAVATGATTGSSTAIPIITFNNKGLVTTITTAAVIAPAGTLTGTTLASNVVTSSLTAVGTIGTGVWQGTLIGSTYGGTGVNNGSATLTMAGSHVLSGAFTSTFTFTGATGVTFPTSGTLATVAGTVSSIAGTANEITASAATGAVTLSLPSALTFTGKTVTGGTFASGAFNGTLGATTPSSVSATTLAANGTVTLSALNTANGLLQTNGSGVVATTLTPAGLTSLGVGVLKAADGTTALTLASATGAATFSALTSVQKSQSGLATVGAARMLRLSDTNGAVNSLTEIGFGYDASGVATYQPVVIGHKVTNTAGNTSGSFYVATRNSQSDVAPTEWLTISSTGTLTTSGASAPTSTTSGSNQFTAGIATSGPAYVGGYFNVGSGAGINGVPSGLPAAAGDGLIYLSSAAGVKKIYIGDGTGYSFQFTKRTGSADTSLFSLTDAGNATLAGNLTVSGTGPSSFAGNVAFAAHGNFGGATDASNRQVSINHATNAALGYRVADSEEWSTTVDTTNGFQVQRSGVGTYFSLSRATGVATFGSTTSGTSTTNAALLAASAGFTGALWVGGSGNFAGAVTQSASSDAIFEATTSGASNYSYANFSNTGASGKRYQVGVGGHTAATPYRDNFYIDVVSGTGIATFNTTTVAILPTTEATTGGVASLTTAGGSYTAKTNVSKHFSGYGTAPTGAVGTGAGTSPGSVTFDASANDAAGTVSITTGTLPTAAGTVMTVTFNGAYATAPHITLTPANAATALLSGATMVVPSTSTTTFVITAGATGLVAATGYSWFYHLVQ